ncbi:hypothetical protein NQZ68_016766 [Dissostichus eleginoides]|nr:hypothetical protein NQZ68_016766 [Dissostichus eleginoides]
MRLGRQEAFWSVLQDRKQREPGPQHNVLCERHLHTFSLLITSLIVTSSNEALIHSCPPASEGLTADAPPPRRQDQIRTSGVGVQQGGRLMIREGLKGGRGSEWAGSLQEQSGTRRRRLNDAHTAVWELKRLQERGQEVSVARML